MKSSVKRFLFLICFFAGVAFAVPSCKGKPSDADIKAAIEEKVRTTPEMEGVSVSVSDGVVTMTGQCKDDACRTMSENTIKGMEGVKSVINNATVAPITIPEQTAPVDIAADDEISKGVTDATKDYPGVNAAVNDGVITLTGEIKRDDLQRLLQSLNSLKPKKIDNQLVIK